MNKRWIAASLAAVMTMSAGVFQVGAVEFTDVPSTHWSYNYVNQASNLGIISGIQQPDGTYQYQPDSPVSYNQTMQMIYGMAKSLGSTQDVASRVTKWQATMTQYNVPTWAQQAVSYCLESGIVDTTMLKGDEGATREEVACMIGRVMSKVYGTASKTATHKDLSQINSAYLPYVNLLDQLEIMQGDTAGNFNPKKSITRAEMAVVISKSYAQLKMITQTGTMTAISSTGTTVNGANYTYSSVAKFTLDGQTTTTSALQTLLSNNSSTGLSVAMVINGAGQVISMSVTSPAQSSTGSKVEGRITQIGAARITIKKDNGDTALYYLQDDTTIRIDDRSSDREDLEDAFAEYTLDAVLTVNYEGYITRMEVTTDEDDEDGDELTGFVTSFTSSRITIQKAGSSSTKSYYWLDDTDDVDVEIDGDDEDWDTLEDAYNDDTLFEVTVTLNSDDEVKRVEATTKDVTGKITDLDVDDDETIEVDDEVYDLASNVTVYVNGSKKTLDNLQDYFDDDDEIMYVGLTLNSSKDVSRIDVIMGGTSSSSSSSSKKGTIKSLTKTYLSIGSTSNKYYFKNEDYEDVTFSITDGDNSNLTDWNDLSNAIDEDDKTIYVTATLNSDDEITKLTGYVESVKGEIKDIDEDDEYIKLDLGTGIYRYNASSSVDIDDYSSWSKMYDAWYDDDDFDTVLLTLDEDGEITDIEIVS